MDGDDATWASDVDAVVSIAWLRSSSPVQLKQSSMTARLAGQLAAVEVAGCVALYTAPRAHGACADTFAAHIETLITRSIYSYRNANYSVGIYI